MMKPKSIRKALTLAPEYRHYVWGGDRLLPGRAPTAEAWVVYAGDRISTPPFEGSTLAELAEEYGEALLGSQAVAQTGRRFPLLIKLLDVAAWLSLQVHPDDAHAKQLEGPEFFGKTEAWHFLESEPGAEILCGVKPGTSRAELEAGIRGGKALLEHMQHIPVQAGDSIFIPAGTIHALGPGLLVYEVQQTSDLTYRVYDWDRPATKERPLHIEKSLAVADPTLDTRPVPPPAMQDGDHKVLIQSRYFALEMLAGEARPIELDTRGESFAALTAVSGSAELQGEDWRCPLGHLETALIPADCGAYRVQPAGKFTGLWARVGG